jgi:predicted peptidase
MRPLVVFLHGGGEAGTDNLKQMHPNIDFLFAEAKRRGAFLLAPQAPLNWRPRSVTDSVMTLVDRSLVDFNVDPDRLYLTGYSSGGGGTWNMLSRYPGRFAASVPVAPVSAEPDFTAANLVGQPIAAFHARDDTVAPVGVTRNIINSVLTAAGEPLPTYPPAGGDNLFMNIPEIDFSYIETTLGGHSVHFAVYDTPQLYDWMFSHGRPIPEPGALVIALIGLTAVVICSRRRRAARGA